MNISPSLSRFMAFLALFAISFATIQAPAQAAMITTDQLVANSQVEAQRNAIAELLQREDIKRELLNLGVNPNTINDRVASMTPAEVSQIHGQLADLPAAAGLGTVALVILILILLEIAGVIDIFPGL